MELKFGLITLGVISALLNLYLVFIHAKKKEERISTLKKSLLTNLSELDRIKLELLITQAMTFDLPIPMWLKSVPELKMTWLNKAYESYFLLPVGKSREDYINKYDKDIWNEETSDYFLKSDKIILSDPNLILIEHEMDKFDYKEVFKDWYFIKFARRNPITREVIGVAGIALPQKTNKSI